MHLKLDLNFKKRKRLERDYDVYSKANIPHTLKGQYAIIYAKNFHDRAITCVDLANIYWLSGNHDAALIYMDSAIADLKKAINIYAKLQNKQPEIAKYSHYVMVFKENIRTIKHTIKHAETPKACPKLKAMTFSPLQEPIFKTQKCKPVKSKKVDYAQSPIEDTASMGDDEPINVFEFS